MRVVYANNQNQIINVGRQGENLATAVYFDLSELIAVFGEGTFAIVHKRAGDETPYPVTHTERIEDCAVWTLDATDTAIAGVCKVELRWYVDDVLAKTVVYDIVIQTSLGVTGDVPDPYEDIIDTIAGYARDAEDAKDAAQGYAGTASQSAIDAAASERAAGASETAAANSERAASGYALTASQKADAASSSAQTASDKASAAQGYAQTASGKASEAQGYAQTASGKADAAAASAQTASDKADAASSAAQSVAESAAQIAINKENIAKKADAIVKSVSGAVASFSDGADGMPMVSVVAEINPKQLGSGDPSPDNVRPISGWDSVNVTRTGKNLFGGLTLGQAIVDAVNTPSRAWLDSDANGNFVAIVGGSSTKDKVFTNDVKFKPNTQYTFIVRITRYQASANPLNMNIGFVYTDGTIRMLTLTFSSDTEVLTYAFVSDENKTLENVETIWGGGTTRLFYEDSGIFEGVLTVDDYEPYVAQTYPTTLPQTVYGGTLDLVSGVLTITHKRQVFNGTEYWSMAQAGYFVIAKSVVDANLDTTEVYSDTMISNYLPYIYNQPTAYPSFNAITSSFRVSMPDLTTWDAFKAYLGTNNLEIIVKYATPQTIQLTPQEVDSLLADNNVWADSGNIAVTYRADSTLAYEQLTNAIVSLGGNV